ncbi:phage GP46 family protein [Falsiroseomonas sp. CW058]|uniref:phage GP46 family protein n=1 Tax=Falsiroseomonas sp. CW058 TaxID=3388664 RepID=UPI003D316825
MTATDIAIVWDPALTTGDWQLTGDGALLTAAALETAVIVSLFTDARADPGDRLPPGETDRRGWWGNALGDPVGSRLWLLRRSKRLPETLALARDYIREALAWLVEDGLADRVEVATEWRTPTRMGAVITVTQPGGGTAALRAEWAWGGL